jgi:hypothetical protein
VFVQATNAPGSFQILVNIPGNVTATVLLPAPGGTNMTAVVDGNIVSAACSNGLLTVTNIGSGRHWVCLGTKNKPLQTAFKGKQ